MKTGNYEENLVKLRMLAQSVMWLEAQSKQLYDELSTLDPDVSEAVLSGYVRRGDMIEQRARFERKNLEAFVSGINET